MPEVDAAIAAIEARDAAALVALMHFELQPCAAHGEVGGSAVCPPGVTPGTAVEAFDWAACDGGGRLREGADEAIRGWLNGVQYVYGAYRRPSSVIIIASADVGNGMEWGRHLEFFDDPARGTAIRIGCAAAVEPYSAQFAAAGALPLGVAITP